MSNQLDELFVSGKEVDQGLVAGILSPFLKIDLDSCSIVPSEYWLELHNELKVILFLVARKAMKVRGLSVDKEGALPSEIEEQTGMKGGSVRPNLKNLFEQRIIKKTDDSRYFVPNYSLVKIKTLVDRWLKERKHE